MHIALVLLIVVVCSLFTTAVIASCHGNEGTMLSIGPLPLDAFIFIVSGLLWLCAPPSWRYSHSIFLLGIALGGGSYWVGSVGAQFGVITRERRNQKKDV